MEENVEFKEEEKKELKTWVSNCFTSYFFQK